MSEEPMDLVGKWGVCSQGRVGRIEGRKELPWGDSWVGTDLDGNLWASRNPRVLSDTEAEMVLAHERMIEKYADTFRALAGDKEALARMLAARPRIREEYDPANYPDWPDGEPEVWGRGYALDARLRAAGVRIPERHEITEDDLAPPEPQRHPLIALMYRFGLLAE